MDLTKIHSYLSYEPYLQKRSSELLDDILLQANYLNEKEKKEVVRAYEYAKSYHEEVKRLS